MCLHGLSILADVPDLADEILRGNKEDANAKRINLQGFLVGGWSRVDGGCVAGGRQALRHCCRAHPACMLSVWRRQHRVYPGRR